jgi:amidase
MGLTTAREIADAVRGGRSTAHGVMQEHLERIATLNPQLGALVALREAGALADAADLDLRIASGADPGPLAGVPFTVKDVIATVDLPTTCGSRALAGNRTGFDAVAVARLRSAGAVLVGKSNAPEFAFGTDTVNELYGQTRNPRGPFTVGGSSGGEAAAVAAGMSAFGIGTDFGGSLRWPAQCAALVGMRPAIGTVPQSGQLPLFDKRPDKHATLQALVQTIGPLTHDVADSRLVLSVLTGAGDPQPAVGPDADVAAGVEILWGSAVAGVHAEPQVHDALGAAATFLAGRGAEVTEGLPAVLGEAVAVYAELRAADPLTAVREAIAGHEDLIEERTRELLARTPARSQSGCAPGWEARRRLVTVLDGQLGSNRLLLLPVATTTPAGATGRAVDDFSMLLPSRAISLFGLAALSLPWGNAADGSPLAVQLVAPRGREDLLFAVAGILQTAHDSAVAPC